MAKYIYVLLIVVLVVIGTLPKHLPITSKSGFASIESEYSDFAMQTKSAAIKAYLDRMEKESAIAGKPRFVSNNKSQTP